MCSVFSGMRYQWFYLWRSLPSCGCRAISGLSGCARLAWDMRGVLVFDLRDCMDFGGGAINYIAKKNGHTDFQIQLLLPTWAAGELQNELSGITMVP